MKKSNNGTSYLHRIKSSMAVYSKAHRIFASATNPIND